jgi:hypothetical protein
LAMAMALAVAMAMALAMLSTSLIAEQYRNMQCSHAMPY